MILNEIDVTDYIYNAIHTFVEGKVNGKVYHNGCRPSDSNNEDAVIVFSTADANDVQNGIAYLNIYVKDIDNGGGRMVLNRGRIKQIMAWSNDVLPLLNTGRLSFSNELAPVIIEESATKEHFVSIRLKFKVYTLDNNKPSWGKCKVVLDEGKQGEITLTRIAENSTILNVTQGVNKEYVLEGGNVASTKYLRNKYSLQFIEYGNASLSNVDGIAGTHSVKVICYDSGTDKPVLSIPKAVINIQNGYSSEDGNTSLYTCRALEQEGNSIIRY